MTGPVRKFEVRNAIKKFAYLLFLLVGSCDLACGQVTTGTPPLGSFTGGPDVIDLANLNANVAVPIFQKAGRGGMGFYYDLAYDTSVWYPVTVNGVQSWQPVFNWGWTAQTAVQTGYISYRRISTNCDTPPPLHQYVKYSNFIYHDMWGIPHPFSAQLEYDPTGCDLGSTLSATAGANDNSGYTLSVATAGGTGLTTHTVTTTTGQVTTPPLNLTSGYSGVAATSTDRNGNQISVNSTGTSATFTDTLNTTAITVTGTATPASPLTFTYAAPSAQAAYNMKFTAQTVQTKFGCSITDYGPTVNNLVSEIDLPDSTKYVFTYETTPGDTHNPPYVTGRLASVTAPTGGTITYAYTGGSTGHINCSDGSASGFTRTTSGTGSDGTWTYTHTPGTGNLSANKVTDPLGNETDYEFSGLYEINQLSYQGSSSGALLKQLVICYNNNFTNCGAATVTPPISKRDVYTYFPNLANPGLSETYYNAFGLLTDDYEYDYVPKVNGLPYVSHKSIAYATLGNNINAFSQTIAVKDANGNTVSQTVNNYDETTPTATSGVPQHVGVTGSRGNVTSTNYPVTGLTSHFSYFDTGTVQTATDVNGAVTTNNYTTSSCAYSFPTSVNEPLSLSRSFVWNCNGGVLTQVTDENSNNTFTAYTDAYFWRPSSQTDATGAQTNFTYTGQNTIESVLTFNSGNSASDVVTTFDGLGRVYLQQTRQSPTSSNYDSVETDYDSLGRSRRVTLPYVAGRGQGGGVSAPAVTTTYDAMSRPLTVTDSGNGSISYSYPQNDALITEGPAPSGENTKRRQQEFDALGRLTSVCEVTGLSGSGACGQNSAQTGYWTKYTYNVLGNLLSVTQNAQASAGNQQTRSYTYDAMGRLTAETNPESGTTNYTYDTATCGTSKGDMVKKVDALGIATCVNYDSLHRPTSTSYTNSASCKFFVYDRNPGVGWTEGNVKGRLSNAYIGNCSNGVPTGANEGYNYSARGELINVYQTSVASGVWYNSAATYWPNGALNTLQLSTCITNCTNITNNTPVTPLITYNADGEGRAATVSASSGQNPVTATTYNPASQPMAVTFGSADSDARTYDPNTYRMTKYQYNVNGRTYTGALTWNSNGSLGTQTVTDPFNSADNQTCNYSHDDLVRIASVNCGASIWQQNFTYDAFGNITKTVPPGGTGNSFLPIYSTATNRIASLLGCTPAYDADGQVLNDCSHTYTWDPYGNSITVDGVALTFDAAGRMVEQNRSGTLTEIVYTPTGQKFALMNGVTLQKAFVPLPAQAVAVYTSAGLDHYRHSDWLGSNRLASSPTRTVLSTLAYAPFGETYAWFGSPDKSFTGQNPDTTSGDYDFRYREYSNQGRWASPDPAGLSAVGLGDPQSLNRYSYVRNNPASAVDPLGLCDGVIGGFGQSPGTKATSGQDQFATDHQANRIYPFAGSNMAESVGALIAGPGSNATRVTLAGVQDTLAQTPAGEKSNFVLWSGSAQTFSEAFAMLSPSDQAKIGNIVYLSPGVLPSDPFLAKSSSGSTSAYFGTGGLENLVTAVSIESSVLQKIDAFSYDCEHDANCAFGHANLAGLNGRACPDRKLFRPGPGGGSSHGGFGFYPPSLLGEAGWTLGGFAGWITTFIPNTSGFKPY
jgi:RHS repeat-associated protein